MKYYFTFILNSILNFMAEVNVDVDDGTVSKEDYFIVQSIMLGSLRGETIAKNVAVVNHLPILHLDNYLLHYFMRSQLSEIKVTRLQ